MKIKHGQSGKNRTPTYTSWKGMHRRCASKEPRLVKMYAGIKVCERWSGENGFVNFLSDMGERPSLDHSIDRIKGHLGYCPKNCRWTTDGPQNRNRKTVINIRFKDEVKCAAEWSIALGKNVTYVSKALRTGRTLQQIFKSEEVSFQ